jgi:hypothetical protein
MLGILTLDPPTPNVFVALTLLCFVHFIWANPSQMFLSFVRWVLIGFLLIPIKLREISNLN